MKCAVIYYSQTGNTELVARAIHAGIKTAAGQCDIFKIKDANPRKLWEYDLIGIGCPVHDHVEPVNVTNFIKNIKFIGGKHVFCFCTHATHGEFFLPSIAPKLKSRGLVYIGAYDCFAPCFLPEMPEPFLTSGHPDEVDLKEAEEFGRNITATSKKISEGNKEIIPCIPEFPPPGLEEFRNLGRKRSERLIELGVDPIKAVHKARITIDTEKCLYPECRLCMDYCPMDGIDLSINPPVVATPCMSCRFCPMVCPTGAVIDKAALLLEDFPEGNRQSNYVKWLAEYESKGLFRRLVRENDIDWDIPIYMKYNKHPQWIVGKGLVK